MGSGFSKMKKQARMMQQQMDQMKEQMRNTLVEGSAGNGLVKVKMTGEKLLQSISIQPECTSDLEGLQDLIVAAFKDAYTKLEAEQKMPSDFSF